MCDVVLDEDEAPIYLDVKSLYTNVPVEESIAKAADSLYERNPHEFVKATFVEMKALAKKYVVFRAGGKWKTQVDGLAMGSKLVVFFSQHLDERFS